MNWDAIGAVGEVIGALAVVATLFYLVIQVRQSRQATEANTRAIRGNASWDAENVFARRYSEFRDDIVTVNQIGFFPDILYRIQF